VPAKRYIVVTAASVRAVLRNHEAVSEQKVKEATSDPVEQARLVAGVNNALLEIATRTTPQFSPHRRAPSPRSCRHSWRSAPTRRTRIPRQNCRAAPRKPSLIPTIG
jgi:hypothetical protein